MKMRDLILSMVVTLSMVTGSLMAQYSGTNTQVITALPTFNITAADTISNAADTATIGAQMPYFVNRDPFFRSRPSMFNPSAFGWTLSSGTLLSYTGTPLTPLAGIYADTIVRATLPGTAGLQTLTVYEQSRPTFGTGCADVTPVSLSIQVVGTPSIAFSSTQNDTVGGCSASATYSFSYDFTNGASFNRGPFYVSYSLAAYDFGTGAQIGTTQNYTAQIPSGGSLRIDVDQMAAAAGTTVAAIPSADYRIVLNGLWDKFSVRATNAAALVVDPATTSDAHIMLLPTPVTRPIKHIQNL